MKKTAAFLRLQQACLVLSVLLFWLPASQAQIEEVVVTAQKRQQSINDVGITVNAFTTEQLDSYGVKSAEDLEALTPGLTVSNSVLAGVPVYTIRGVGFNDFTTSSASTVGLYLDETSIPYATMSRGVLFDVERVEVLKGPQGDLYGRNTTAGQINFISRKPTEEFEAGIKVDYSRFNVLDLEGYVSGAVTDAVRGRLAVKHITLSDGWQRSITREGDELGEEDNIAVRGLFDIDVSDNLSALLNIRYYNDQSENTAGTAYQFLGPIPNPENFFSNNARDADWSPGFRPQRDNELVGISAKIEWELGNFTVTSLTSYDDFERSEVNDNDGVAFEFSEARNTTEIDVFSQELRVSSSNDSGIYWVAGLFYSTDDVSEQFFVSANQLFPPFLTPTGLTVQNDYEQDTESVAVFGHVEWDISEKFRLTLGGRYTDETRDWTGCSSDTGDGTWANVWSLAFAPAYVGLGVLNPAAVASIVPGACLTVNDQVGTPGFGAFQQFSTKIDANETQWKATLDYSPTDDILIFGTIATGFKSGGFNGSISFSHESLLPFEIENLTSYELGIKATLLDGNMQINASTFYYDYEDKQELTRFISPTGPTIATTNIPESEVLGAELEMTWYLTDRLKWHLGVAYVDTEITEFQSIDLVNSTFLNEVFFDASGFHLDNAPEWQVNSTVSYEWPLTDALNVRAAVDVAYKDDNVGSIAEENGNYFIPDYTIVNARLGIASTDDRWSVTVWGRNITDEFYWTSAAAANGTNARLHALPVTYGVTLSYNYF